MAEERKARRGAPDSRHTLALAVALPLLGAGAVAALAWKIYAVASGGADMEPPVTGIQRGVLTALGIMTAAAIAAVVRAGTIGMYRQYREDREAETEAAARER